VDEFTEPRASDPERGKTLHFEAERASEDDAVRKRCHSPHNLLDNVLALFHLGLMESFPAFREPTRKHARNYKVG